jgi:competence protein ComGA
MIKAALRRGASDIYLFPQRHGYQLRIRYPDGIETEGKLIPIEKATVWINLLKYRAGMNLSEHRRVQQGAVYLDAAHCYLRLSSAGDFRDGESMVIRLIAAVPPVTASGEAGMQMLQTLAEQRGLLTVCGPTGAGKTTLLYQLAQRLADDRVVMTIEDPVEITEPQFLQLQVNNAAGMTYASLLKATLRHRPDVVIIGELRDAETARAACEAALAGHIVMATVHTKSPRDVPLRLISMGVPAELVHGALHVSAQVQLDFAAEITPRLEIWRWQQGEGQRLTASLSQEDNDES